MKVKITITATLMIAMLALGLAAPAQAEETVVFQATVNRSNLVYSSCVEGVCTLLFQEAGAANIMGPITESAYVVQNNNTEPCSEAHTEVILIGATGTISLTFTSAAVCPGLSPWGGPYTISGSWEVTGGTGEFEGITGYGTAEGVIGGRGPLLHYSGVVSY